MKHTPGPWRFAYHDNYDVQFSVACVVVGEKVVFVGSNQEHYANARLMAAAPEMLEALQIASQRISGEMVECRDCMSPNSCRRCQVNKRVTEQVLKSIANATGKLK